MPNRLHELRIAANLSTRDLERATGIDHAAISRLETKDQGVSEHYARLLADHFNVTIDYLLCRTDANLDSSQSRVQKTSDMIPESRVDLKKVNRLKDLRMDANLTMAELAKLTDTNDAAISRIENGQQSIGEYYAHKFADFFNVSLDFLMCRSDNREAFNRVEVRETPLTYKNVLFAMNSFTYEELLRLSGTIDFLLEDRHKKLKGEPQPAKDKPHSVGKPDAN